MAKLAAALLWALALVSVQNVLSMDDEEDVMDDQDIEEEAMTAAQLKGLFSKFDANKDGRATLQEIMAFAHDMSKAIAEKDAKSIIEEIDTNKDGKLSLDEHLNDLANQADGGDDEEMKELEKRKVTETAKFQAADENGDGFLAPAEIGALFFPEVNAKVLAISVKATMEMKDKDGDAMLTPKEFWEFGEEGGADDELTEEEIQDFQKLDKDGDGLLNAAELTAWESGTFHTEGAMLKLMELADKNGDMAATLEELETAREELAASDAQYHLIEWAEHHEL